MGEKEFTHLTETGVHMVEVGAKPQQRWNWSSYGGSWS